MFGLRVEYDSIVISTVRLRTIQIASPANFDIHIHSEHANIL